MLLESLASDIMQNTAGTRKEKWEGQKERKSFILCRNINDTFKTPCNFWHSMMGEKRHEKHAVKSSSACYPKLNALQSGRKWLVKISTQGLPELQKTCLGNSITDLSKASELYTSIVGKNGLYNDLSCKKCTQIWHRKQMFKYSYKW